MAIRLGLDAKLYRNTGTIGSNIWSEVSNVRDVTLNLETGEADVTTRGNDGWRATVGTLKDAGIEFEMVWDTEDANFTAFKDAFFDGTPIELLVADGSMDAAGAQGLRAVCRIITFTRSEALEEGAGVNVEHSGDPVGDGNARPVMSADEAAEGGPGDLGPPRHVREGQAGEAKEVVPRPSVEGVSGWSCHGGHFLKRLQTLSRD